MKYRFLMVLIAAGLLSSCKKEEQKLQSQVDSLKNELEVSQQLARTLTDVGVLMDSIDANRQARILDYLWQAPDHPVLLTFPEGLYLKGLVCQVD